MKKIYLLAATLAVAITSIAQTDTTTVVSDTTKQMNADTIRLGQFTIIKKNKTGSGKSNEVILEKRKPTKPSNLSTNWWVVDIGFANLVDKTTYGSTAANNYLQAGSGRPFTKEDMNLRSGKTSNVNIWVLMQRLNITKGVLNLKYGVGLEMFNYRYQSNISYRNPAGQAPFIFKDSISFTKNKLVASYVSVPLMLNLNTTPGRKKGLSLSAGVSAGYLVASRNKQISGERGKEKIKGDFDLEKFRLAYVGEIGMGPIRLFGSYSMTRLHERGLEQYPYSLGIRFSSW